MGVGTHESAVILVRSVEAGPLDESALGDRRGVRLGSGSACHGVGVGSHLVGLLVGRSELGQGIRHLEGTDPGGHQ